MALSMIVEITSLTPRVTFEHAGDAGSRRPTAMAMSEDQARRGGGAGRSTPRRPRRAQEHGQAVLALDADVEEVHLEADGDRDAGEVVGARPG